MSARVLLVNPWIYDFAAYNLWCSPLGLLSMGALLRAKGYDVALLDCLDRHHPALRGLSPAPRDAPYGCGHFLKTIVPKPPAVAHVPRRYGQYGLPLEAVRKAISSQVRPDVILVTSGMTYWYPGVVAIIRELRTFWPDVPVALGGIYATLCPDHARAYSGADIVMPGADEVDGLRLVEDLVGSSHGRSQSPLSCDDIPFPAHDLRFCRAYVALRTSKGCPYHCPYCGAGQLSPGGFSQRRPEQVVGEIGWCYEELGVRDFAFYDDALLVEAEMHLLPILEGVLRRGWDCRFHTPNGLHAALVDRVLARQMFRAGFRTIRLGLETASARHDGLGGYKVSQAAFQRAVSYLLEAGFRPGELGAYILVGLPEQGLDEVRAAVDLAHGLGVRAHLATYSFVPGTPVWQQAVEAGLVAPDADPLLHNNTLLPGWNEPRARRAWEALQEYVRRGNASLCGNM